MTVDVSRDGAIATVTINRPDALNACNTALLQDLLAEFTELRRDASVRAVIITGAGDRAFIAGADIAEMQAKTPAEGYSFSQLGQAVCDAIESFPCPVIAAINGFALGGGCEIAMACDIRIASESARIGQPEVGLGIPPGWGATQRLPRIVGIGLAKELIYTGRHVRADEAKQIGLVNEVCTPDELAEKARQLAGTIAANGPTAVRYSKELLNNSMETSLQSGKVMEAQLFGLAFDSDEQSEGMSAFLERRKPDYA